MTIDFVSFYDFSTRFLNCSDISIIVLKLRKSFNETKYDNFFVTKIKFLLNANSEFLAEVGDFIKQSTELSIIDCPSVA